MPPPPPPGYELLPQDDVPPPPPPGYEMVPAGEAPPLELRVGERASTPEASVGAEGWGEYLGGLGLKAAQGLTFNYADELAAAAGSLVGYDRRKLLESLRRREERFGERHPYAGGAAELAGALASGVAGGAGLTRLVPALGRAGGLWRAAGTGAALGAPMAALSETGKAEGDEGLMEAARRGLVSGGAWGAGLGAAGGALGRVAGPWITPQAEHLRQAGVTLTPGEMLGGYAKRAEDVATSAPFVGALVRNRQAEGIQSFNRAAVRQALAPDAVVSRRMPPDAEVGYDLMTAARDQLRRRYNEVVPRMHADARDPQLINDLNGIWGRLPTSRQTEFRDAISRHIDDSTAPNNIISGRGMQNAIGGLRDEGRRLITSQASQAYDRDLGQALMDARDALVRAARRRTSARTMGDFDRLQHAYAGFTRLRDAASRTGADMGTFTPAQLMAAVRSGDRSAGKGATATGEALLQDLAAPAKSVMTRRVNDSGTPERSFMIGAVAAPHLAAQALVGGIPLGLLYTRAGRALFERLAAGSPQTRAALRRFLERAGAPAGQALARTLGG